MLTFTLIVAVAAPLQDRVPEISLGARTGAITEPFSDAMGMAELRDGRVIVSDRVESVSRWQIFVAVIEPPSAETVAGRMNTSCRLVPFAGVRIRYLVQIHSIAGC